MSEFKDHIIGIDTKEESMDNCLVTVLISIKSESMNQILGYRCKYPKCYFIELTLDDAYEHVKCYHKIDRPFQCNACKAVFKNSDQLLMHKKSEHNDNRNKCDKQETVRSECVSRNDPRNRKSNTTFTNSDQLLMHKKSEHNNQNKCDKQETVRSECVNRNDPRNRKSNTPFTNTEQRLQTKTDKYVEHQNKCDKQDSVSFISKHSNDMRNTPIISHHSNEPKNIGIKRKHSVDSTKIDTNNIEKTRQLGCGFKCHYTDCGFITTVRKTFDDHFRAKHCSANQSFTCTDSTRNSRDNNRFSDYRNTRDRVFRDEIPMETLRNRNINPNRVQLRSGKIFETRRDHRPRPMEQTEEIPMDDNIYVKCVRFVNSRHVKCYRCAWPQCDVSYTKKELVYTHVRRHTEHNDMIRNNRFPTHSQYGNHTNIHSSGTKNVEIPIKDSAGHTSISQHSKDSRHSFTNPDRKVFFKNHCIGTETYEKKENNGLIAVVFSKKHNVLEDGNHFLGYRCLKSYCNYICPNRTAAVKHVKRKHGLDCGQQNELCEHYKCTHCDEVFNNEIKRYYHWRDKHGLHHIKT